MAVAFCPECGEAVRLGQPEQGQRITCNECGAALEVISLTPLELDWAYDEPVEDWEELDEERQSDADWDEDWVSDEDWDEEMGPDDDDELEVEWEEY